MEEPAHFQPTYEHKNWHWVLWLGLFVTADLVGGFVYVWIYRVSSETSQNPISSVTPQPQQSQFVNGDQFLALAPLAFSSSTETWILGYGDTSTFPQLENGAVCFTYQQTDLCNDIYIQGTEYDVPIDPDATSTVESYDSWVKAYEAFLDARGYVKIYTIEKAGESFVYEKLQGTNVQLVAFGSVPVRVNTPASPSGPAFLLFISDIFHVGSPSAATTTVLDIQGNPTDLFKDTQYVYWIDHCCVVDGKTAIQIAILGADPGTFVVLGQYYTKDKNHVYHFSDEWEVLPGADPKTFKVPEEPLQ